MAEEDGGGSQGWKCLHPGRKEPFRQAGPQDSRVPFSNPTRHTTATLGRSVRHPPPTYISSQTPRSSKEPSPIHPRLPPQTWTSREQPQPEESPHCSHGHGHASRGQRQAQLLKSICAPTHRYSDDTPRLGSGHGPEQTGTQTRPWGPPVALTAAEQDGRAKAQTAATRSGPRRCPRCQRPSARPCPRRRPTSRASACPRAGAAAGPAAQAGGRGRGGAADPPGEGAARVLKTHPRPARRRGGPTPFTPPARLPQPPRGSYGSCHSPRVGERVSRIPDPRSLPAASGSRPLRGSSQGLG